jgi:hypothetical protein
VSWTVGGSIALTGGMIAITNESDGVWNLGAGSFALTSNGAPVPPGTFTFVNAGTMQGTGSATTTLTVGGFVSFSSPGTVNGIQIVNLP